MTTVQVAILVVILGGILLMQGVVLNKLSWGKVGLAVLAMGAAIVLATWRN